MQPFLGSAWEVVRRKHCSDQSYIFGPQPPLGSLLCTCSFSSALARNLLDQVAVIRRARSGVRAAGGWGYTPPETGHSWLMSWQLLAARGGTALHPHPCTPTEALFSALHLPREEAPGEPNSRIIKDTESGVSQTCLCPCLLYQ